MGTWLDPNPALVALIVSNSVLEGGKLSTDELISLVLWRISFVEVLKMSGPIKEAPLLDDSGVSIGVVATVVILSLLRIEDKVSRSLLSNDNEPDSDVELTIAGVDVVSNGPLLSGVLSIIDEDKS